VVNVKRNSNEERKNAMGRSRKTPKPKLPTHERIDPKSDPHEVYPLLNGKVKAKPKKAKAKTK